MLTEIQRFVNRVRRRNPNAHTWHAHRADPGNSSSPSAKSSNSARRDLPSHERRWALRVGLPRVSSETCDARFARCVSRSDQRRVTICRSPRIACPEGTW